MATVQPRLAARSAPAAARRVLAAPPPPDNEDRASGAVGRLVDCPGEKCEFRPPADEGCNIRPWHAGQMYESRSRRGCGRQIEHLGLAQIVDRLQAGYVFEPLDRGRNPFGR